jgi:hypothetical protein
VYVPSGGPCWSPILLLTIDGRSSRTFGAHAKTRRTAWALRETVVLSAIASAAEASRSTFRGAERAATHHKSKGENR